MESVWGCRSDTAPYSWYQTLKPALLELGFVEAGGHPCTMIRKVSLLIDGKEVDSGIMLTIYVDDLVVAVLNSCGLRISSGANLNIQPKEGSNTVWVSSSYCQMTLSV